MIFEAKSQSIKAGTETPAPWVLVGSGGISHLQNREGASNECL